MPSFAFPHTVDSPDYLAMKDQLDVGPLSRQVTEDLYLNQVRRLEESLGAGARVGSVDKFQGQEAPIVFISLCTSDAAASPRGIDFLFDRNRLNVAVSRAQTLVVVVGQRWSRRGKGGRDESFNRFV